MLIVKALMWVFAVWLPALWLLAVHRRVFPAWLAHRVKNLVRSVLIRVWIAVVYLLKERQQELLVSVELIDRALKPVCVVFLLPVCLLPVQLGSPA